MRDLQDTFGRKFPYIRLSITDVCNFKCTYCLPRGYKKNPGDIRSFMSAEEISRLVNGLSELGVRKIRLTGGEPTVRKDFFDILKNIIFVSGNQRIATAVKKSFPTNKILVSLNPTNEEMLNTILN